MSTSRPRSRTPPPRPTTPLRPSSRTSFRSSTNQPQRQGASALDSLEPQFAELSDSLSDLETNLLHLQLMHESLSRFSENFASFLYGLEMNAFVVDWPEQPLVESIQRWRSHHRGEGDTTIASRTPTKNTSSTSRGADIDVDSTLLSDTTFASLRATPAKRRTIAPDDAKGGTTSRGRGAAGTESGIGTLPARNGLSGGTTGRGTRGARGARGSGLPTRGRGRGLK